METAGPKILLIEPNKNQSEYLIEILMDLGYEIVLAGNLEKATRQLLRYSPELIICQKDLNHDSGFLFYSMLQNKFSDKETPFILLLNNFRQKDLSLGIEMGIDSFLFPPFDRRKISNIVKKQLQKRKNGQQDAVSQFKSFFEITPFGFFVCKNKIVVDANQLFFKLVNLPGTKNGHHELTDLFYFGSDPSNELNLLRCLNGISDYCSFCSIPLQSNPEVKFNIYVNVFKNEGSSLKIAGLVIPDKDMGETQFIYPWLSKNKNRNGKKAGVEQPYKPVTKSDNFFTTREKQVLQLSSQGIPIKQIASQMSISVRTVEKHRSNIFRKTNTGNIVEAVFYANKKQLIELN